MQKLRWLTLIVTLVVIIATGTVFFHHVEGWNWLDSYFFTVVTLSTVGYGELVPATAVGKIGTTVFILVGLGVFAVAVQQFGQYAMRKREEHTEWLIARLDTSDEKPANDDDPPDRR
ncbi:potassium channel family protein [Sagittula stellata]|uniref:Potassium channel protein n=1 Tax=Sagittula stellata (strain ATCC 700073 / DSM 11524 / E-37) TaxID=388399 RepID=A3K666_SAGS3|nr:potassium channel family protein [Sagittula stellata]EBA07216.1 Potassium channel protein [Sagittula stellata E-37]